jgi:hypothetical protein
MQRYALNVPWHVLAFLQAAVQEGEHESAY